MDLNWCPTCGIKLETYPIGKGFTQVAYCPKCDTYFELDKQGTPWHSIKVISETRFKFKKWENERIEIDDTDTYN